jgi:arginase
MPSNHTLTDKVAVLGLPLDENSSFLRGPALAPAHIRAALHSGSSNLSTEFGLDLGKESGWQDLGDMQLSPGEEGRRQIEAQVLRILEGKARLLLLGGDHSVTYPVVRAFARHYPGLNVLHLDAHSDLYPEYDGSPFSHACPFARIMEEGLAKRLVQVGIRTLNDTQREQAERFGVEVIEMRAWRPDIELVFDGALYLSLDLDVLDPAFAPGLSHPEPGGFSTREVLRLLEVVRGNLVGADIVELNPTRDVNELTALTAAKFYKEIVARMLGKD